MEYIIEKTFFLASLKSIVLELRVFKITGNFAIKSCDYRWLLQEYMKRRK
jgi:hypothetical protein